MPSWVMAAVNALPLVIPIPGRERNFRPPPVIGAVSAPRPTTSAPSDWAVSTADSILPMVQARRDDSIWRAPTGTVRMWPATSPVSRTRTSPQRMVGIGRRRMAHSQAGSGTRPSGAHLRPMSWARSARGCTRKAKVFMMGGPGTGGIVA